MKKTNMKDITLNTTFGVLENTGFLAVVALASVPVIGSIYIYKRLHKKKK